MLKTRKTLIIILSAVIVALCLCLASCDIIEQLFHTHAGDGVWHRDETYHWLECSTCSQKYKKAKHVVAEDGWIVVKAPTETQTGERQGKCSVCDANVTETVDKLSHEHAFTGDYVTDELGHWKECSCGEKDAFAEHEVDDWTIEKEPTETTQGQKRGVCTVCGDTVTGIIPAVNHTHNYVPAYGDVYHYNECTCGDKTEIAVHVYSDDWQTNDARHWKVCECGKTDDEAAHVTVWIIDVEATTTSTGSKHEECSVCHKVLSTVTIDKITTESRTVDFYAINDFHGEVDKISTVGGYLKERKNENANTLLINSGDMFQGSMESNSNYGKLLTDCMDAIGFDAFAFGNHEFDWGLEKLENLAQNSNVPFLGANIYHWNASAKTWGTYADELAQKYVIKTLDNGLKVGIIGVIGENQITSISSNLVQTIGFKDPLPIIKQLATELRNEQKCDVVVVTAHASPRGLVGESEGQNDPEEPNSAHDLGKYVDAVFCAHTHREQIFNIDGLTFIQGGSYGSEVSHITLTVDASGNVTCSARDNISYSRNWNNLLTVTELVSNSNDKIKDERNQVLATLSGGYLNKNPAIPRLVSRAVVEYAHNQGHTDVVLAMVNTARNSLSSGSITYSQLYEAIPFDNEVYIARVKGSEIISEVNYGVYFWRASGVAIESNKYYKIAVIDYLLFHQNASRNYNYFRSAFESSNTFKPVALTQNGQTYNYRQITRDYLLNNPGLTASVYVNDNNNTDTSLLGSTVELTYQTIGNWQTNAVAGRNDASGYYANAQVVAPNSYKKRKVEW